MMKINQPHSAAEVAERLAQIIARGNLSAGERAQAIRAWAQAMKATIKGAKQ